MSQLVYEIETYFPSQRLRIDGWSAADEEIECGFIAEPYWPEMYEYINITKESGMNRARSAANRRKALEEHLRAIGMTYDEFETLKARAHRPFSVWRGEIIIARRNIAAFLYSVCDEARAAQRPCPPDQVRSRIALTPWRTGKTEADGKYVRFATVTGGTGAVLSNQRSLRSSQYIADFTARGQIAFDDQFVKPDVLRNAIEWGGEFVGIGAARKMGFGRFELKRFERVEAAAREPQSRAA